MKIRINPCSQARKVFDGTFDLGPEWIQIEVDAWETLELLRQEDSRIWNKTKLSKPGYFLEYIRDTGSKDLRVKFTTAGRMGTIVGMLEKPNVLTIHRIDLIRPDDLHKTNQNHR